MSFPALPSTHNQSWHQTLHLLGSTDEERWPQKGDNFLSKHHQASLKGLGGIQERGKEERRGEEGMEKRREES